MNSSKTGFIIAAAFIGPGTVTTASLAGAQLGYGLFWALLFSVFATFIVQEMSSRLGLVTGLGLSENLMKTFDNRTSKFCLGALVVIALGIGNAAYEGGNIAGAALGLANVAEIKQTTWVSILGIIALGLVWSNSYKLIESVLVSLVAVMSTVFIVVMLIAGFDFSLFMDGLVGKGLFSNNTLLLAILGTTIVPYNLFLHAGLSAQHAQEKMRQSEAFTNTDLKSHQKQLFTSIGIGGLVTFAIMSCAANAYFLSQTALSPSNIANQLQPLLGEFANSFFALGLFSAGITSALTAPLATAYALCGVFGFKPDIKAMPFKIICTTIIAIGVLVALSGYKPFTIIVIAQASNALLLPISLILLLYLVNQSSLMQHAKNTVISNALSTVIILVVVGLGISKLI
ncbi:Nramp family divalent metal transporter [Glaciecola sp. KUL10]|uniref:Nramp family divalent metal transporter n=1 Tax=Glaciecola sp. (strain KUL10) TaxID=2161813 RepID=UPI000D78B1B2|nr:Nramp family divalent metal transporter [Glaciecola sp. KUL10]GBL03797.1 manganese/divalent cation transport protein [Glaciecola sp. KUL10]